MTLWKNSYQCQGRTHNPILRIDSGMSYIFDTHFLADRNDAKYKTTSHKFKMNFMYMTKSTNISRF